MSDDPPPRSAPAARMIERSEAGPVAVLTMRHGPVNAMDIELLHELTETFVALATEQPAAVVLTGAGRAFSAGVDLRRMLGGDARYLREFLPALSEALHTVFTFDRPVVAAVNGHAIAGGCVLACCADLRLMADGRGRIGIPEIKVGVPFPRVPLEVMVHAVGSTVATRLLTRADTLAPADALAVGLVDQVVDPAELVERAVAAATELATEIPADTFALTKTQLRRDSVERMARYRADEDVQAVELWQRRVEDGWTARYLKSVTGRS